MKRFRRRSAAAAFVLVLAISARAESPPANGTPAPASGMAPNLPPPPSPTLKCSQRDAGVRNEMLELLKQVEASPPGKFSTVDQFLAALPESIRKNMIFMTASRSLQGGTVDNPRVILKSPNSDVTLSFSTDPKGKGFDAVELAMWNGATAKVELTELRFPGDSADSEIKSLPRPKIERNPAKCVSCHQSPARFVWDTYRFWAGQTPFAEDALHKGSVEVTWYQKFLGEIAAGVPRLRQLKPLDTIQDIDQGLAATGRYQLRTSGGETTQANNTPALDMSHQFLKTNGCRIGNQLADRPDWNQIKYAVAGALNPQCANTADFLDASANAQAAKHFEERGIGLDANGKFSFDALLADTKTRQQSLALDKEGRQFWLFEQKLGYDQALKEMDLVRKNLINNNPQFVGQNTFSSFEDSQNENTKARYLLEPLGIEVNRWSMAIDPESYGHNQFFKEILLSSPIQTVLSQVASDPGPGGICEKLAARSKALIKVTAAPAAAPAGPVMCEARPVLEKKALEPMGAANLAILRSRVEKRLQSCADCHVAGVGGAPPIPFQELPKLEKYLAKTKGKVGDLGERIWDRLTRHPEASGFMPKGDEPLTTDEKVDVRRWLNAISSPVP